MGGRLTDADVVEVKTFASFQRPLWPSWSCLWYKQMIS